MKIKSITKEKFNGKVYNFHCLPNENYFANGVLVHNCYKSNQPNGLYMPFEKFRKIFDLMNQPKTMTQIAFGVDAQCRTNPDVWRIMDYCRENDVVPNVTVADIDSVTASHIVERCGACAVSAYERNLDCCYESIDLLARNRRRLGKANFKINIHCMLSEETKGLAWRLLDDYVAARDGREGSGMSFALRQINAIVFLSLKQKGRGDGFHILPEDEYRRIVDFCLKNSIPFGMDSCGANKFLRAIEDRPDRSEMEQMVEECESTRCSFYVNVEGKAFPCSFMEGEDGWKDGVDLLDSAISDYGREIWHHSRVEEFRNIALKCIECHGRNQCPHYKV